MKSLKKYLLLILSVTFLSSFILASGGESLTMLAKIACLTVFIVTATFIFLKLRVSSFHLESEDLKAVIHSGSANHFKNIEAVGGKLFLLRNKLKFQSHGLNIQNKATIINIDEIKTVGFYNTLGIIPNGLAISMKNGQTEKFVVSRRVLWKNEIEKLLVV